MNAATLDARLDDVKIQMSRTDLSTTRRPRVAVRAPDRYHHGDLRAALLAAAEQLLLERGADAFTMRECARRAGVSHAAPAHHFGDVRGLLTAVAAHGFERMSTLMAKARAAAGADTEAALTGVGLAYVEFAVTHPAQFALMQRTGVIDHRDPQLERHAAATYDHLRQTMVAANGAQAEAAPDFATRMLLAWAAVHGFAMLALEGKLAEFAPGASPRKLAQALAPAMLERLRTALVVPRPA